MDVLLSWSPRLDYAFLLLFFFLPGVVCIQVYAAVLTLESGLFDYVPERLVADVAPSLREHHDVVLSHPKVLSY